MSLIFRRFQSSAGAAGSGKASRANPLQNLGKSTDSGSLMQILKATAAAERMPWPASRTSPRGNTQPPRGMMPSQSMRSAVNAIGVPPRTGVLVGRSVPVNSPERLPQAIKRMNLLNKINQMPKTVNLQRFAERPGKARLRVRISRKKREFNAGIRRLFDLVNEARRKGY